MKFLLQSDPVCQQERRAILHAAMLTDSATIFSTLDALARVTHDDSVPVGTVEFVSAVMSRRGLPAPAHLSYPDCLSDFLQRDIRAGLLGEAAGNVFVKPRHEVKRFTGALLAEASTQGLPADFPVWISEPVEFISEWRYYITNGKIVGAGRYDDGADDISAPDLSVVDLAAGRMAREGISGFSLDFGVLKDGRTALIEANDGWALGYYKGTCTHVDYARLLHARWMDISRVQALHPATAML